MTGDAFPFARPVRGLVGGILISLPDRRDFGGRLIVGSALFGVGWVIAGLCPAPALASLATPKALRDMTDD